MISLEEIEKTIIELEARDTTYATCEKLADLYVIKDHLLIKEKEEPTYERQKLAIIDELLETLSVTQPKLYQATMEKILGI